MTPILQPDALRRLAWLKSGPLRCAKDFPDGQPFFLAGREYQVQPNAFHSEWNRRVGSR